MIANLFHWLFTKVRYLWKLFNPRISHIEPEADDSASEYGSEDSDSDTSDSTTFSTRGGRTSIRFNECFDTFADFLEIMAAVRHLQLHTGSPINRELLQRAREISNHPPIATRQPIQGDCGICMHPLLEEDSEESTDDSDGSDDSDESDDSDSDSGDESDDAQQGLRFAWGLGLDEDGDDIEKTLLWCRVQCGTNFHRDCLLRWFSAAHHVTCPNCRSDWVYPH